MRLRDFPIGIVSSMAEGNGEKEMHRQSLSFGNAPGSFALILANGKLPRN